MKSEEFKTPKDWKTQKKGTDNYVHHIPKETIEKWNRERREKDGVLFFINENGFHLPNKTKPSGVIYYVDTGRVCEINYEVSGVETYDILVYWSTVIKWSLPKEDTMSNEDKDVIYRELQVWLNQQGIKASIE